MENLEIKPIFKLNPATYENAKIAYSQPDLSSNEICKLVLKSRAGDTEAKGKILLSHLKAIYSTVGCCYYLKPFIQDIDDFIQEGVLGVAQAIDNFDPKKASFSTYSNYWIRKKVSSFMREKTSTIRCHEKQQRKMKALKKAAYDYEQIHGEKPDQAAIIELTGMGITALQNTVQAQMCSNVVSLNQYLEDQFQDHLNNTDVYVMSHEEDIIDKLTAKQLAQEIYRLVKKDIDLKIVNFFLNAEAGATHKDCANALSVSRQYVSKRLAEIRKMLKKTSIEYFK